MRIREFNAKIEKYRYFNFTTKSIINKKKEQVFENLSKEDMLLSYNKQTKYIYVDTRRFEITIKKGFNTSTNWRENTSLSRQ